MRSVVDRNVVMRHIPAVYMNGYGQLVSAALWSALLGAVDGEGGEDYWFRSQDTRTAHSYRVCLY
jgi:hypothetical protein